MQDFERRPSNAVSTYEAGYYYAPAASLGEVPQPGTVPAEEMLLTLTGTWPGNLANCLDRALTELDVVTKDPVSFRPETGKRYRAEADTLDLGVVSRIQDGWDLCVGKAYTLVLTQDESDSDTSRIVFYVLRKA